MKYYFKMFKRINEVIEQGGAIYIRCAGAAGQQLLFEMQDVGINVDAFLDSDVDKKIEMCNIPVLPPETIYSRVQGSYFVLIAIRDDHIYEIIENDYKSHGLKVGIDYGDFSIDAEYRMANFEDIKPSYDFVKLFRTTAQDRINEMKDIDGAFDKEVPDCYNLISNLDFPLTTFCSLKCDFCSHCIPYANPPKHFDVDVLISDLNKLLDYSYVECLAIMGGEPLVYPDLNEFIRKYKDLKNKEHIGFTRIVTNGTVLPTDGFFAAYKELDNAYIYISNYGEKSKKIDQLIEKCKEYDIGVFVCPFSDDWVSLGGFSYRRNYTEDQLKHLYAVCGSHSCVQLLNGRIYSCGRTPILNEDGLIPFFEHDFCEIRNANDLDIEENLHRYLYEKPFLEGCQYCDGQHLYSKKVRRGE